MRFAATAAQERIRTLARKFALEEAQPTAAKRDAEERFDRGLFDRMGELGLTGIPWPERYGGLGADFVPYVLAVEEISRVCAATGVMLSVHTSLTGWCLFTYGTEEQKGRLLRPLAQGKKLGAYCLTESGSGSDAKAMRTQATRDGDGRGYALNGSKLFVTSGGEADVYIVFAMTDPDASRRSEGCSAFIVEKGMPGLRFGKKERKLGLRSSPTLELVFEDCRVPKENLLGPEGDGFKIAMSALDGGRCGIAAQALGISQGALDAATDFARMIPGLSERRSAGYVLAGLAARIAAARRLVYQAAWRESEGLPYRKEAALAKLFASDAAVKTTQEAIKLFGDRGYTDEFPVERYWRDAKATQIYEGTNEIQRIVVSRLLLNDS